ncbi:MAG: hypothetical protein HRU70_03105 [Phycisphaeraceae bacterium]|nr:MAG: hypothetical protein HRU70_03105 [Phycisphaeraceae bacterium]
MRREIVRTGFERMGVLLGAAGALVSPAHASDPPALTKRDLCDLIARRPMHGAAEVVYNTPNGLNLRVFGYDAETGAWYSMNPSLQGYDPSGRHFRTDGPSAKVEYAAWRNDEHKEFEQRVSPQVFARKICEMPQVEVTVEPWEDGGLVASVVLPLGSRRHVIDPLPAGAIYESSPITLWVGKDGLVRRFRASEREAIVDLEYEPGSLGSVPVARSYRVTKDGEAFGLLRYTWFGHGQSERFTLEAADRRRKEPGLVPPKIDRIEAPTPAKAAEQEWTLEALGVRYGGPWYAFDRLRWPMLIAGVVLVTLGVVAYVRQRR